MATLSDFMLALLLQVPGEGVSTSATPQRATSLQLHGLQLPSAEEQGRYRKGGWLQRAGSSEQVPIVHWI
jgi:hypothetical protein